MVRIFIALIGLLFFPIHSFATTPRDVALEAPGLRPESPALEAAGPLWVTFQLAHILSTEEDRDRLERGVRYHQVFVGQLTDWNYGPQRLLTLLTELSFQQIAGLLRGRRHTAYVLFPRTPEGTLERNRLLGYNRCIFSKRDGSFDVYMTAQPNTNDRDIGPTSPMTFEVARHKSIIYNPPPAQRLERFQDYPTFEHVRGRHRPTPPRYEEAAPFTFVSTSLNYRDLVGILNYNGMHPYVEILAYGYFKLSFRTKENLDLFFIWLEGNTNYYIAVGRAPVMQVVYY